MLVVSIIASTLVVTQQGWFNGCSGLYAIPQPFSSVLDLSPTGYGWFFLGVAVGLCVIVLILRRPDDVVAMGAAPAGDAREPRGGRVAGHTCEVRV